MMATSTSTGNRAGTWIGRLALLACCVSFCGVGCNTAPQAGPERGAYLFDNYCESCHGAEGAGIANLGAPGIAGLPEWYVRAQLDKFRGGQRGTHFDDIEGMRMRPMSRALTTDADVGYAAAFVASLPAPHAAPTLTGGDAAKGKSAYATCMACHGPDGKGNQALNAPPLAQQDDWYLQRQIQKFRAGIRGAADGDTTGAQMAPMAATLADEQAILDVVAHIKSLDK